MCRNTGSGGSPPARPSLALWPLLLGRSEGLPDCEVFCVVTDTGNPVWSVAIPLICQPPSAESMKRFQ